MADNQKKLFSLLTYDRKFVPLEEDPSQDLGTEMGAAAMQKLEGKFWRDGRSMR